MSTLAGTALSWTVHQRSDVGPVSLPKIFGSNSSKDEDFEDYVYLRLCMEALAMFPYCNVTDMCVWICYCIRGLISFFGKSLQISLEGSS